MSLSKPTTISLRALAAARVLVGSGTLLLPTQSAWLFGLSPSIAAASAVPGLTVAARLFGVRDMVIGGYLWTSLSTFEASTSNTHDVGAANAKGEIEPLTSDGQAGNVGNEELERFAATRQLRHAIWLGLISDSIDVMSGIACLLEGGMGSRGMVLVYGGAVLFASIGMTGVRAMKGL